MYMMAPCVNACVCVRVRVRVRAHARIDGYGGCGGDGGDGGGGACMNANVGRKIRGMHWRWKVAPILSKLIKMVGCEI